MKIELNIDLENKKVKVVYIGLDNVTRKFKQVIQEYIDYLDYVEDFKNRKKVVSKLQHIDNFVDKYISGHE